METNFREIQANLLSPMPYKFRLQSAKYGKATVVSYIDSRQVQDKLDEAVGAENWQVNYEVVKGNLFASIGILTPNGWVWKSDCGTESNIEKEKGEASDSFKRAAVMWGIGRFLYSLPILTLKTAVHKTKSGAEKEYPADKDGKILWNSEDLNKYCRSLIDDQPQQEGTESQNVDDNPKNQPLKPELLPNSAAWKEAVKWLADQDGLVFDHLDKIKGKYSISEANEKALVDEATAKITPVTIPQDTIDAIAAAKSSEEVTNIWNELTDLHTSKEFIKLIDDRRKEILLPKKKTA